MALLVEAFFWSRFSGWFCRMEINKGRWIILTYCVVSGSNSDYKGYLFITRAGQWGKYEY